MLCRDRKDANASAQNSEQITEPIEKSQKDQEVAKDLHAIQKDNEHIRNLEEEAKVQHRSIAANPQSGEAAVYIPQQGWVLPSETDISGEKWLPESSLMGFEGKSQAVSYLSPNCSCTDMSQSESVWAWHNPGTIEDKAGNIGNLSNTSLINTESRPILIVWYPKDLYFQEPDPEHYMVSECLQIMFIGVYCLHCSPSLKAIVVL